jgi:hypothetical protein
MRIVGLGGEQKDIELLAPYGLALAAGALGL